MRRLYTTIICVFLLVGCEHGKNGDENTKDGDFYLKQGNDYWGNEEYDKAITNYTKAIERYKDNNKKAFAYFKRGAVILVRFEKTEVSVKRLDDAIADATRTISLSNNSHTEGLAYSLRGAAYYYQKLYDAAVLDLSDALSSWPGIDGATKAFALRTRSAACNALKKISIKQWNNVRCHFY